MYWDPNKHKMMPRSEVIRLQHNVLALEAELARLELEKSEAPDSEDMVRRGGMVHFDEEIEPRFMGASSGIAMSRLVLEQAKLNTGSRNVRELFPAEAGRRETNVTAEAEGGQVKAYPSMSSVSAERLPIRATTDGLVGVFCQKCGLNSMIPPFVSVLR